MVSHNCLLLLSLLRTLSPSHFNPAVGLRSVMENNTWHCDRDLTYVVSGMFLRQLPIQNPTTGSEWSASLLFSLSMELIDCWEDDVLNGEISFLYVMKN